LARGPYIMSNTRLHVRFIVRSHYEVSRLQKRQPLLMEKSID
jgi:hypothetical protein